MIDCPIAGTDDVLSQAAGQMTVATAGKSELPRRLGTASLVLMAVAFNSPMAAMAGFSQLSVGFGNGAGAPVSFLVAGAILLIFAVGFVGMSPHIENAGAFYHFIVKGLGKRAGLAGAFLGTTAYLLLCGGSYPYIGLVTLDFMNRVAGSHALSWQAWALIFMAVITALGLLRIDLSVRLLSLLVCLEVAIVALYQIAVGLRGGPEGYSLASYSLPAFLTGSPGLGVLLAMLCMVGVEAAVCFRAEAKDPARSVGRATYIAIILLGVFFSLGAWAYIVTQGPSRVVHIAVTDPVGSFVSSVGAYLGKGFVTATSLTLVTSMIVSISAIQGAASRYLFQLGRDGILPRVLGSVHPRLQSPYVAVIAISGVSLVMMTPVFLLDINPVTAYAGLTGLGIYFMLPLLILTSISIIAFYRSHPALGIGAWSRRIAPAIAAIALTMLFVITSLNLKVLVVSSGMVTVGVLAVVIVPIAGWGLAEFYRRRRPHVYASI